MSLYKLILIEALFSDELETCEKCVSDATTQVTTGSTNTNAEDSRPAVPESEPCIYDVRAPTKENAPLKRKEMQRAPLQRELSTSKNVSPRIIAIGTSLVKDLYLQSAGVNGITYCYPGQYVNYIASRIPYILQDETPDVIFLQCAGNDIERCPNYGVIRDYEKLISTVRRHAPNAIILIGAVPLRGKNIEIHTKIRQFNTYLYNRGRRGDGVEYAYAAPRHLKYFKRDLVHFNFAGATVFQDNIVREFQYRLSFPRLQDMILT